MPSPSHTPVLGVLLLLQSLRPFILGWNGLYLFIPIIILAIIPILILAIIPILILAIIPILIQAIIPILILAIIPILILAIIPLGPTQVYPHLTCESFHNFPIRISSATMPLHYLVHTWFISISFCFCYQLCVCFILKWTGNVFIILTFSLYTPPNNHPQQENSNMNSIRNKVHYW